MEGTTQLLSDQACFGILLLLIPFAYFLGHYHGEKEAAAERVPIRDMEKLACEVWHLMRVIEPLEEFVRDVASKPYDRNEYHPNYPEGYYFEIFRPVFESERKQRMMENDLREVFDGLRELRKISNITKSSAWLIYEDALSKRRKIDERNIRRIS